MSLRLLRLSPLHIGLVLFAVSLTVRAATFAAFGHPAYVDSIYYSSVAQAMAAGDGMSIGYLWAFSDVGGAIPAVPTLPLAAFAHWAPLASFIQLPFILLLGPSDFAAALPFMLLSSVLAPMTYALTRDLLNRRVALLAGVLAIFPGVSGFLAQTDNFSLFAVIVTAALWLIARALRDGARVGPMAAAGVLTAGAFLSRNDGVLVAGAVMVLAAIAWRGAWRGSRARRLGLLPLLAYFGAALLGVAPWLIRQIATFGSISPSAASGRILWIREYSELFGADGRLTPDHLLSWGWGNIAVERFDAAAYAGAMIFTVLFAGVGLPLALLAIKRRPRHPMVATYGVFFVVFHLWAVLIAAPHLPAGNYLHGAVALVPMGSALVALGLRDLVVSVRSRWSRGLARRVAHNGALLLVAVYASLAIFAGVKLANAWAAEWSANTAIVQWLDEHADPDDVVYASAPGIYWHLGQYAGVPTPTSAEPVVREVASSYGADWLILDASSIVDVFKPVLTDEVDLPWLSADPVFEIPGDNGKAAWVIYRIENP